MTAGLTRGRFTAPVNHVKRPRSSTSKLSRAHIKRDPPRFSLWPSNGIGLTLHGMKLTNTKPQPWTTVNIGLILLHSQVRNCQVHPIYIHINIYMYIYIQAMYLGTNGVQSPSFRLSLRTLKALVCLVRVLTRKFVYLIYTQSPLRARTHTHIYIHSLSHAHIHCPHVSVRIHCLYICVYMCIYRYICTYTHMCTFTYTYLCIYICICVGK